LAGPASGYFGYQQNYHIDVDLSDFSTTDVSRVFTAKVMKTFIVQYLVKIIN